MDELALLDLALLVGVVALVCGLIPVLVRCFRPRGRSGRLRDRDDGSPYEYDLPGHQEFTDRSSLGGCEGQDGGGSGCCGDGEGCTSDERVTAFWRRPTC